MNLVWLDYLDSDQAVLSSDLVVKLNEPGFTIHFGALAVTLNILPKEWLLEETIGLPLKLSAEYTIPADVPYEVYMEAGEMYLGPVIGHVVPGIFADLNEKTLSTFLPRFAEYESIKGVIFICTKDSINTERCFIEGYYYNPEGKETGCTWKYGKFPFPNAMFNRSYLSQEKIDALSQRIGHTIFNSYWYNLNKWNIWRYLSKDRLLREHLPYTERYTDISQLRYFLNKYKSAYLKPFRQFKGRGIINVLKKDEGFAVVKNNNRSYHFDDEQSIDDFIKKTAETPLIIQQAVPYKIGDQLLDFRVFLQRNESKDWSFQGSMARISKPGSIITTSQGREDIIGGREALLNIYGLNYDAIDEVEKKMAEIVQKAVEVYEKRGMHIGDIAADLILDSNLHLWLLELQSNYASLNVPIPQIYKEITVTPFKYAKALAGFAKVQQYD